MAYWPSLGRLLVCRSSPGYFSNCTHPVFRVDIIDGARTLRSCDHRNSLDRDFVPKAFTFAIHDTWNKNIAANTVFLGRFDDGDVRIRCLDLHE
jgi:hypothetical protein